MPLAVWLCESAIDEQCSQPLGDAPVISGKLLHRIISAFSHSGDRIALHGADHTFLAGIAESVLDRTVSLTTPTTTTHSDTTGDSGECGDQALVATLQPPQRRIELGSYRRWARLLRPGGVLTVVTSNPAGAGRFHNHLGAVVTAARAAGLVYVQHIVAVAAHVEGDRLLVPAHRHSEVPRPTERALVHVPAHHDVLVFSVRPVNRSL